MVEPPRLITPEIATRYDRSLHTVTKTWARHPDWPAPVGKRGRYKEYDADAVDAFVRQHVTRQTPDLEPGRLYTVQELAAATGIAEPTIRADLSRGRWPAPDDTAAGVHRWRGRTVTDALDDRPSYTAPDDAQEEGNAMAAVHTITSLDATWKPGDVVLDAEGNLRVRSAHPKWVWDYTSEGTTRAPDGGPAVPDGALEDRDVPRPLILLVRDGQAVTGLSPEGDG